MKVRALKTFNDLKKTRFAGEEFEITKERYEYINSASQGLIEVVEEDIDLDNMTKKELIEYAREKGIELDIKMTKKEMIEELV